VVGAGTAGMADTVRAIIQHHHRLEEEDLTNLVVGDEAGKRYKVSGFLYQMLWNVGSKLPHATSYI